MPSERIRVRLLAWRSRGRGGLRVPAGRRGKATCPCGAEWFHPATVELSEVDFVALKAVPDSSFKCRGDRRSISS
jgi:hypothetical protein